MYFNSLMFYIPNNISKKDLRQLKQKAFESISLETSVEATFVGIRYRL